MQKATPIENLPSGGQQQNVQMMMTPEPTSNASQPPHPPMQQEMREREEQRRNDQENFMNRQFVPNSGMPQGMQEQPPQRQMYNQGVVYQQHQQYHQPQANGKSLWQQLMGQSKLLTIVFALLFTSQLQTVQTLFRMFARMVKVPDGMVFTASKLLVSLTGAILFFFILRNL